jgi:hypothetical protein
MKNGTGKDNTNRWRASEDRNLEGEQGEYTADQRTTKIG